jgi:hypothetical protein
MAQSATPNDVQQQQAAAERLLRLYYLNGAAASNIPQSGPAAAYFQHGADATSIPQEGQPGAAYFQNGGQATSIPQPGQPGAEYFQNGADATTLQAQNKARAALLVRQAHALQSAQQEQPAEPDKKSHDKITPPGREAPPTDSESQSAAAPAAAAASESESTTESSDQDQPPSDEAKPDEGASNDGEEASAEPHAEPAAVALARTQPRDAQAQPAATFAHVANQFGFAMLVYASIVGCLGVGLAIGITRRRRAASR